MSIVGFLIIVAGACFSFSSMPVDAYPGFIPSRPWLVRSFSQGPATRRP